MKVRICDICKETCHALYTHENAIVLEGRINQDNKHYTFTLAIQRYNGFYYEQQLDVCPDCAMKLLRKLVEDYERREN